jgi:hypothetical protein
MTEREIQSLARDMCNFPDIRAPVQGYAGGIPWEMHMRAYEVYAKRWSPQVALIDLYGRGCRGGFGLGELDQFLPNWRDELSERTKLIDEITALRARIAELEVWKTEVDNALASYELTTDDFDSPRAAVRGLIELACQIALDPTVSPPARALVADMEVEILKLKTRDIAWSMEVDELKASIADQREDAARVADDHYNEMARCAQHARDEGNQESCDRIYARARSASQIAAAIRAGNQYGREG